MNIAFRNSLSDISRGGFVMFFRVMHSLFHPVGFRLNSYTRIKILISVLLFPIRLFGNACYRSQAAHYKYSLFD